MWRSTLLVASVMASMTSMAVAADVSVKAPWVRATVPGQQATGAFMELTSAAGGALIGASSPVAGVVQVHEMTLDGGVMKMREVPRVELPAGKTVSLKPGSYHVMLMDLKSSLKKGDTVALTLKLEDKDKKASTLEVQAEVRDITAAAAAAPAAPSTSGGEGEHHHHH